MNELIRYEAWPPAVLITMNRADKRNALRRQSLRDEFQKQAAAEGWSRKIRKLWTRVVNLAA